MFFFAVYLILYFVDDHVLLLIAINFLQIAVYLPYMEDSIGAYKNTPWEARISKNGGRNV
jgi:hypothetical protein